MKFAPSAGNLVGTGCACTRQRRCEKHRVPLTEKKVVRNALAALKHRATQ